MSRVSLLLQLLRRPPTVHTGRPDESVSLQVLPLRCASEVVPGGTFFMLDFPNDAPTVHLEHNRIAAFLDDHRDIEYYRRSFQMISELALDGKATAKRLRTALEDT